MQVVKWEWQSDSNMPLFFNFIDCKPTLDEAHPELTYHRIKWTNHKCHREFLLLKNLTCKLYQVLTSISWRTTTPVWMDANLAQMVRDARRLWLYCHLTRSKRTGPFMKWEHKTSRRGHSHVCNFQLEVIGLCVQHGLGSQVKTTIDLADRRSMEFQLLEHPSHIPLISCITLIQIPRSPGGHSFWWDSQRDINSRLCRASNLEAASAIPCFLKGVLSVEWVTFRV